VTRPSSLVPEGGYPEPRQGLVVVWGLLASSPFGGMTWQVLHHVAGFRRLGFEVWYVEDADTLNDPVDLSYALQADRNIAFLAEQMASIGLGDRWLFRASYLDPTWHGNGDIEAVRRLHRDADAVFNLCGVKWAKASDELLPTNLVYLETDPGAVQVGVAEGQELRLQHLQRHQRLYTYGLNVGGSDFPVPVAPLTWLHTVPPVITDWWDFGGPPRDPAFTTISQWKAIPGHALAWQGQAFEWRKDILFEAVIDLPSRTSVPLELALRHAGQDQARLERHGWRVRDASRLDRPADYREYIRGSAGEFTISKDQYTKLRTGWFSDRSVCYLAGGRPVVTQATGFESHLPTGEGLFAFHHTEGAAAALEEVAADYPRHAAAAREMAREHFAYDRVLPGLLARASSCA